MRLKPQRIALIAQEVTKTLMATKGVKFVVTPQAVMTVVHRVIMRDMTREDEIEKEAAALLRSKLGDIDPREIDHQKLLMKAKAELARRKGLVL